MTEPGKFAIVKTVIHRLYNFYKSDAMSSFRVKLFFLLGIVFVSSSGHILSELICGSGSYRHALMACYPPFSGFCIFGLLIVKQDFIELKAVFEDIFNLCRWLKFQEGTIWIHFAIIFSLAISAICGLPYLNIWPLIYFIIDFGSIILIFSSMYTYNKSIILKTDQL
jgi:hypothetical protein